MKPEQNLLIGLSGRGDKDMIQVAHLLGDKSVNSLLALGVVGDEE